MKRARLGVHVGAEGARAGGRDAGGTSPTDRLLRGPSRSRPRLPACGTVAFPPAPEPGVFTAQAGYPPSRTIGHRVTLGAEVPSADGGRDLLGPVSLCRLIQLPIVEERRGNLTFVESERHVPFTLRRVYYLYDVPGGAERGGHAHRTLHQFMVAMSGSFDVHVSDGFETRDFH